MIMETWWHIVITLGDGWTWLRSAKSEGLFGFVMFITTGFGIATIWSFSKADRLDTEILEESRRDLEKAKAKQLAEVRSKLIPTLLNGGKLVASRRKSMLPSVLTTIASVMIATYAMTKGEKGEYDAAIAKQSAALAKKELSQKRKAHGRIYQTLGFFFGLIALFVKP